MLNRQCTSIILTSVQMRYFQTQFTLLQTEGVRRKGKCTITIPKKKTWSNIAVLQALNESVRMNLKKNQFYPLTSEDFAPNSMAEAGYMLKSIDNAKNIAEFVKKEQPDLLQLQWAGSNAPRIVSTETSEDSDETILPLNPAFEKLEKYLDEKDWENFAKEFQSLLETDTILPIPLAEKIVASICFTSRQAGSVEKDSQLSKICSLVISNTQKSVFTKYMALSDIRKQSRFGNLWEVRNSLNFLANGNHSMDNTTTEMLLDCCLLRGECYPLVEKSLNVTCKNEPTAAAIAYVGHAFHGRMPVEDRLTLWGKCLREMELCGIDPDLNIYGRMLTYAVNRMEDINTVFAILTIIENNPKGNFNYKHCMHDAMRFATKNYNLKLATKVYEVANKVEQFSDQPVTLGTFFYMSHIKLLCEVGSQENFFAIATDLFKQKKFLSKTLMDNLIQICVKRNWPEVLPFLFSVTYNSMSPLNIYSQWFAAAVVLIDTADADTVTQLKHIAIVAHKNRKIAPSHLNTICLLLAKSRDAKALVNVLISIQKDFGGHKLNPLTLEECKKTLGNDSKILNKFV